MITNLKALLGKTQVEYTAILEKLNTAQSKDIGLPVLIDKLTNAKAAEAYNAYSKYRDALNNLKDYEKDINRYDDSTYMRVLRLMLGEYTEYSMEAYYEFISRRFKHKGIPMSTESLNTYINENWPS
jgi:hypothetical protein